MYLLSKLAMTEHYGMNSEEICEEQHISFIWWTDGLAFQPTVKQQRLLHQLQTEPRSPEGPRGAGPSTKG